MVEQKVSILKIAFSFPFLILSYKTPTDDPENSERTPRDRPNRKCAFYYQLLRILPKNRNFSTSFSHFALLVLGK